MTNNPYQAPNSKLNKDKLPSRNTIAWIVFFWITSALTSLTVLAIFFVPGLSFLDFLSSIVAILTLGGLYGFAYYKPLLTVVFWRYFFYVALLDFFLYSFVLPLLGLKTFGQLVNFDGSYLIILVYNITILYALNHYAYKRSFLWQKLS